MYCHTGYEHTQANPRAADVFVIREWWEDGNGNTVNLYPFALWKDGTLKATKADITGTITANEGKIGKINPWTIGDNGLYSSTTNFSNYILGTILYSNGIKIINAENSSEDTRQRLLKFITQDGYFDFHSTSVVPRFNRNIRSTSISREIRRHINCIESISGSIQEFDVTQNGSLEAIDAVMALRHAVDLYAEDWGNNSKAFLEVSNGVISYIASNTLIGSGERLNILITPAETFINNLSTSTRTINEDSSDRNIKKDISFLNDKYELLFDKLNPCKYKYKTGTSGRFHTGFIAQDIIQAIEECGLTS